MTESGSDSQLTPRPGVLQILQILMETRALFDSAFDDEAYFIGSVSKIPSGQRTWAQVGDVDILIGSRQMAFGFWGFMRALLERGIRPVWDICEIPEELRSLWRPCHARKEHPLSLTLNCETNLRTSEGPEFKQYNLDIKLEPSIASLVPMSSKWMWGNIANVTCDDPNVPAYHAALLRSDLIHSLQDATRFGDLVPAIEMLF